MGKGRRQALRFVESSGRVRFFRYEKESLCT
jgi:hypothetical protein